MEQIDNKRIAMSLLLQCAWMWEHCMKNSNEGEFKFSDVWKGLSGTARSRLDAATGMVFVDAGLCQYWDIFNKSQPIEGLTFDRKNMMSTLKFGGFQCSYPIDKVFSITRAFCMNNACQSLMNKTVFGYRDGERWAILPKLEATRKPQRAKKVKLTPKKDAALTFTEQLRAELQRQLGMAA